MGGTHEVAGNLAKTVRPMRTKVLQSAHHANIEHMTTTLIGTNAALALLFAVNCMRVVVEKARGQLTQARS